MQSKLHIDLSQGLVQVEGEADLVREIYRDLKDHLLNGAPPVARSKREPAASPAAEPDAKPKRQRRTLPPRKKAEGETNSSGIIADSPKLDKNLDTAGLPAYYGQFEPKNNPEKVLVFLKFMTDELGIESPNTDQFYTCYEKVNERVPKVFSQTFRDASGRKFGFIDYNSPTDIRVTTTGNNHFKFDLKRKVAE